MVHRLLLLLAVLLSSAAPSGAQALTLDFHEGRVSLSARDVPIRAILAEWARLGGTTIVNGDRVPGGLVTLELPNVPERQAVETLLRDASGYVIGPRVNPGSGQSVFDSILILPTSNAPPAAPARAFSRPAAPRPQVLVPPAFDQGDPDASGEFPPPTDPFDEAPGPDDASTPDGRRLRRARPPGFFQIPRIEDFEDALERQVQPDPEDREDAEPAPGDRPPITNPFGIAPGSTRPGVITPAPKATSPSTRQPDPEP